jgi:predicted Fe-Mo cluster-binding NifX family protein
MRVLFPTEENMGYYSKRGAHFGKAKFYTIVTLEGGTIVDITGVANPGHSEESFGNAITEIIKLKPDVLVVSGIGETSSTGLKKAGMRLYVDRVSQTVQMSIHKFIGDELQQGEKLFSPLKQLN